MENINEEKNEVQEKPKRLIDLANVQVVLTFVDKSGFVVPLTSLQGAFLVRMLGFSINQETGELTHYTDRELNDIYDLLPADKLREMISQGLSSESNP